MRQNPGKVLSRMLAPCKIQCYPLALSCGHDPGSEHPRSFIRVLFRAARSGQRQDLHARVVVIKYFSLCRLADQFIESGIYLYCGFRDNLPLRRTRQRNPKTRLQSLQLIERDAASVPARPPPPTKAPESAISPCVNSANERNAGKSCSCRVE
jgi:hypothetical protein